MTSIQTIMITSVLKYAKESSVIGKPLGDRIILKP